MSFMPHIHCYLGNAPLIWTMFTTDLLIGIAYVLISLALVYLVNKIKVPFSGVILCFGAFIAACGATHFMEVWTLWRPDYWWAAGVKVVTAIASLGTAIYLFKLRQPFFQIAESYRLSESRKYEIERLVERLELTVTERTKELREAEELFRSIFDQAAIGISLLNLDGSWVSINQRFCDIVGYSMEEMTKKTFQEITHPDDLGPDLKLVGEILKGDIATYSLEKRYIRKGGDIVWVNLTVSTIKNEHGKPKQFIACVEDITQRKHAERERDELFLSVQKGKEELEVRVKERTEDLDSFTYSVSHDLRAPLRVIDGFSRILIEDNKDLSESVREYLGRILHNTQKMGQLVDDLLAFSRLGRQPVKKITVETDALVTKTLEELERDLQSGRLEVHRSALPECVGDPVLLKQVWVNLLSNALKYSSKKERSVIHIGAEQKDGQVTYFVKDNGVGFDMRYADKLFGVFQRLHHTEDFDGTGVGLAIVQRIIDRHQGKVWAESQVDQGATFYFSLEGAQA